ncbi:MAG: flagellar biosynthetic protein FliO [Burkholderiaceae bacterium]|nr:flagellar biosynthetic protein FliO [Burkholderiaceae bacterium]
MPIHQEVTPHQESHQPPPPQSATAASLLVSLARSVRTALFSFLSLISCLAFAQAQSSAPAAPSIAATVYQPASSGGGMIWLTFITLLLLAGVVLLVAWLVHKNMTATVPNSSIRILSVQSLGPRERIVIASVVGRVYVLGHTANQISLIAELSQQEVAGLSASPAPVDFAARLSELLRKNKK